MQEISSESLIRCNKELPELIKPFFSQDYDTSEEKYSYWRKLGSFLEWKLLPNILALTPDWPHEFVWCDGFEFFYHQVKKPNVLRALGSSWWRPTDQDKPNFGIEAGIECSELIEIEMRLVENDRIAIVDYLFKIWAKGFCFVLTPNHVSVIPSCSEQLSTPKFDQILNEIRNDQKHNHRYTRHSIASLLSGFGIQGASYLADLLKDSNVKVRRAAAYSLQRQGIKPELAIDLIAQALQDSDSEVQHSAANCLWERLKIDETFIPLLRQSTPLLLRMFGHEPKILRHWFANDILIYLGKIEPSVIPAMTHLLFDENLRHRATKVLWDISKLTPEMVSIYQDAVTSSDLRWRTVAAFSLWRFDVDGGKSFLELTEDEKTLQNPITTAQLLTYEYNATLGLMSDSIVAPVLIQILQRKKTQKRLWCQAVLALVTISTKFNSNAEYQELLQSLIPDLLDLKHDNNEVIQRYSIEALEAINIKDKSI
jgi:hypothetical protein